MVDDDANRLKAYSLRLSRHLFERDGDGLLQTVAEILATERLSVCEQSRARLIETLDAVRR